MNIKITQKYNIKENKYYFETIDVDTDTKIVIPKYYDSEEKSVLAATILKAMTNKYKSRAELDINEYIFIVKAVFKLIGI